jgi:HSP20 family molecular chaperone IbpA
MSQKKKNFQKAASDIELGFGGLLGALNDAFGDIVSKLEDGASGAAERTMSFDTEKGPVRAQAGIRVRMGGMDVDAAAPQPVNRNRVKPTPPATAPRPLEYDVFEQDGAWILTADVPGVTQDDLSLSSEGTTLSIKTVGTRIYEAAINLEAPFDADAIKTTLTNGILTLEIKKKAG